MALIALLIVALTAAFGNVSTESRAPAREAHSSTALDWHRYATARQRGAATAAGGAARAASTEAGPCPEQWPIRWRRSRALGMPYDGRLVRGVKLPCEGRDFFTWDPILKRSPNRWWRRFGTAYLVRRVLRIARAFRASHPAAPRLAIGDLSRPRGGDFGIRYGPPGHASHQNGLDVDIYYPRLDRAELAPLAVAEVDLRLAQQLVDRFVAAGAEYVFVGPSTGLRGPPEVVQALIHHDNHLHVRFRNPAG
jgi:murein endopeptidase